MTLELLGFFQEQPAKVLTVRDGSQVGWRGQRVVDKGKAEDTSG